MRFLLVSTVDPLNKKTVEIPDELLVKRNREDKTTSSKKKMVNEIPLNRLYKSDNLRAINSSKKIQNSLPVIRSHGSIHHSNKL